MKAIKLFWGLKRVLQRRPQTRRMFLGVQDTCHGMLGGILLLSLCASMHAAAAGNSGMVAIIEAAGNTELETERHELLVSLQHRPDLSRELQNDLAKLLPIVDEWANGRERLLPQDQSRAAENGYLCRFIRARLAGEGTPYPPAVSEESPLEPIWAMYRGRMLIWQVIQSGPLLGVKERREAYFGEARRLLEQASRAFPRNRVLRMYLGQPISWPKVYDAHPEAPEWANLQREGLEKLTDLIHWWIDERQLEDGQFGGGWGDDVEMWRWWTPVLIGFEDRKIEAAQEKLSTGMFRQPHMQEGFTSRMTDVEHSNEDTTDTILPMMHLRSREPAWQSRALRLTELMKTRWTGRNKEGFLQFKSIYFSVDQVSEEPHQAFDTLYHPSVVEPALLYWQRTGAPDLTALFCDWLKVWVRATDKAENGKPAGVLPCAIHWPSGGIGASGRPWHEPFPASHNDRLYNWPSAARHMTSTLLLAWHMTGDQTYLQPIRSMAALQAKHMGKGDAGEPGSEAWVAQRLAGFVPDALAKYRLLTGDYAHDSLLKNHAQGYARFRITGDIKPLTRDLRQNAEAFRSNWEAYTHEMRWTDRVLSFTHNYLAYLPEPAPAGPKPETLYSSVTGDPGNPLVFPLNAVRWRTSPRQIAALVTASNTNRLEAELFSFGSGERKMGAEFYLLKPGKYSVVLSEKRSGRKIHHQSLSVSDRDATISFTLPLGKLCLLKVLSQP